MQNKLKIAVIGVGNMGKNHARIYTELMESELVAIVDKNEEVGKALATQHNTKFYSDLHDMLNAEEIDALSVCVPTTLHHAIGKTAIEHGLHLLMEKPIASNTEHGSELLQLANDAGTKLMVGHIERHNPAVKKVKEIIESGELGEVTNIIARRVGPFPPQIDDVDIAVDLAVHDIDIVSYLIGSNPDKITINKRKSQNRPFEDFADFFLSYGKKASAYIQTNWITPVKIRKLNVTGTEGYIEMDYMNQTIEFYKTTYEKKIAKDFEDYILQFAQPLKKEIIVEKKEPLKEELAHFINCVINNVPINSQYAIDALNIALHE